ncbi:MAG: response regulator [Anaerolineae bacterium]|nr:response regulator [Anaerolineae bacterium]
MAKKAAPQDAPSRPLTTGEVAKYCHVSHVAVWKWIKSGKLPAYRLPGGHYRIERGAFKEFLRKHGIPIDPKFFGRTRKRILVIDDDPPVLEVVSRAFEQFAQEVEVATASDGFEAGLQVATFQPDLLILDLMMPRLDGFAVCRLVRQDPRTAHVKILILTAYGSHENIQRALEAGADDFVHKPVDIATLQKKAFALLEGEQEEAQ